MKEQTLDNRYFRLTLKESGEIILKDRESARTWSSKAPFRFAYGNFYTFDLAQHCRMKAAQKGNNIKIAFDRMPVFPVTRTENPIPVLISSSVSRLSSPTARPSSPITGKPYKSGSVKIAPPAFIIKNSSLPERKK